MPDALPRAAAALLLGLALAAEPAHAHGGNFQPPPPAKPGDGGPRPGWRPAPPPPPPFWNPPVTPPMRPEPKMPPTTRRPGDQGPGRGRPTTPTPPPAPAPGEVGGGNPTPVTRGTGAPPTTSGRVPGRRGRVSASAATPDATWSMWWTLNRWRWLPDRAVPAPAPDGVVTPHVEEDGPIDREALAEARRALVVRQHIAPFLATQLAPDADVRPEVRAAAMIALAKISHAPAAVRHVIGRMQDPRAPNVVRESAAYALGMLRRSDPQARMDGERLDAVRAQLLATLDDERAPVRTRAFAALSIGLLGDQPYGSAFTKDGRVISRALWERAQRKYSARDIPVALLTALGRLPLAGTSDEVVEGLQRVVAGRRVGRRRWDAAERSHALDALVRQRGPGWQVLLMRTVTDKRPPAAVQQAAYIAIGAAAGELDAEDRLAMADAVERGVRRARDGLTRGLAHVALGRLLGADLGSEKTPVIERSGGRGLLLGEARHGSNAHRGFSAIALALAVRGPTAATDVAARFQADARAVIARGFEREKDPELRGAYVVALGLLGEEATSEAPGLLALLEDRTADPILRGHAAITIAQLGVDTKPARAALRQAAWDKRSLPLRREASLALSFLGGQAASALMVRELRMARSRWVLTQAAIALGQLGDLDAVPAILEVAADEDREDEARALAVAALGLLGDPEAKPSAHLLSLDANYPSRTDALHEAFTLL